MDNNHHYQLYGQREATLSVDLSTNDKIQKQLNESLINNTQNTQDSLDLFQHQVQKRMKHSQSQPQLIYKDLQITQTDIMKDLNNNYRSKPAKYYENYEFDQLFQRHQEVLKDNKNLAQSLNTEVLINEKMRNQIEILKKSLYNKLDFSDIFQSQENNKKANNNDNIIDIVTLSQTIQDQKDQIAQQQNEIQDFQQKGKEKDQQLEKAICQTQKLQDLKSKLVESLNFTNKSLTSAKNEIQDLLKEKKQILDYNDACEDKLNLLAAQIQQKEDQIQHMESIIQNNTNEECQICLNDKHIQKQIYIKDMVIRQLEEELEKLKTYFESMSLNYEQNYETFKQDPECIIKELEGKLDKAKHQILDQQQEISKLKQIIQDFKVNNQASKLEFQSNDILNLSQKEVVEEKDMIIEDL